MKARPMSQGIVASVVAHYAIELPTRRSTGDEVHFESTSPQSVLVPPKGGNQSHVAQSIDADGSESLNV